MSNKADKEYFQDLSYLGSYIKEIVPFLNQTSCMSPNRRRQLAVLEWLTGYLSLENNNQNNDLIDLIEKTLKPLIQKLGFSEWARDPVTDMAIRIGTKSVSDSF
jgi:hypothetical protein